MSAAFTPAPWRIGDDSDDIVAGVYGEELIATNPLGNTSEQALANARLIAAAPELYDVLAAMISKLGAEGYYPVAGAPLCDRARDVLAKARGDQ